MRAPGSRASRRTMVIVACVVLAIGVAVAGIVVAANRSSPSATRTAPASTSTTAAQEAPGQTSTAVPAGLKEPIVGLLDRHGEPQPGYDLAGWVVKTSWADLQPSPGGPIAGANAVDAAVARARALGLVLKLRVYAGTEAPGWAKELGGPPVPVVDPGNGSAGTVGRFWTDAFGRAYAEFQALLAARYDGVAEIRETVMTRCTTIFAEPFIRQTADAGNIAAFTAAGLNDEADLRCFREQVDAHDVWKHTRSDLAVNPYQSVQAKATARSTPGSKVRGGDLEVPEKVMQYCRQRLGPRCILENNSLRADPSAQYVELYQIMKALGRPLAFQTATGDKVGDLTATVALAADLGAASVELPISYRKTPPPELGRALAPARARLSP